MKSTSIITLVPISHQYLNKITDEKEFTTYNISELRRLPLKETLKKVHSINSDILKLCYEDINSKSLRPVLIIIGFFTKAKRMVVVNEKFEELAVTRWSIIPSLFKLFFGTIWAHINLIYCYFHFKFLIQKRRIDYIARNNNLLYLKSNLWFGVKVGGSIGHISGVINAFINKNYYVDYMSVENPVMLSEKATFSMINTMKIYGLPQEVNLYSFQNHMLTDIKNKNLSKYGLIYSRMSIANCVNVVLSRKLKIPLILEYNGSEVWVSEKWGNGIRYKKVAQLAEDICLKFAQKIVVISQVLKEELMQRGIEESRIVFYPNCIDPLVFNNQRFTEQNTIDLRNRYSISSDDILITFIGTFGQWHGAEKLAKAIRILADTKYDWLVNNKVKFLFVGDGLNMPLVKQEISSPNCSQFCILAGLVAQSEAPLHLASSDILMSPHVANKDGSKFFGSPTKLFEYMAMGKGIIASDLDQIGIVLKNSLRVDNLPQNDPDSSNTELALLTPPGDVSKLIESIIFMVENKKWRITLGKNASIEANKKYTWDQHVSQILDSI